MCWSSWPTSRPSPPQPKLLAVPWNWAVPKTTLKQAVSGHFPSRCLTAGQQRHLLALGLLVVFLQGVVVSLGPLTVWKLP